MGGAGGGLGEGGAQTHLPGHNFRQQAGLGRGEPESRQRHRTEDHRRPQRDRGGGGTLVLKDETRFGQARPDPPEDSGTAKPEQVGGGQLRPTGRHRIGPAVCSTSSMRAVVALPANTDAAACDTATCSSLKVKSIYCSPGRNIGSVSSSSTATSSTVPGMPMASSSPVAPMTSATMRVPSSNSTTAMGNG